MIYMYRIPVSLIYIILCIKKGLVDRTWLYNDGKGPSELRSSDVADTCTCVRCKCAGLRPARRRSYLDLGAQYHAVTAAVTNGAYACPQGEVCDYDQAQTGVNNTYGYDLNGNQTTRTINGVTLTLSYDAEGRMISVTGQVNR